MDQPSREAMAGKLQIYADNTDQIRARGESDGSINTPTLQHSISITPSP
jgi:hypothetical protein